MKSFKGFMAQVVLANLKKDCLADMYRENDFDTLKFY